MCIVYAYSSPLGDIQIAADENSIIGVWFRNQKYYMRGLTEYEVGSSPIIKTCALMLDEYFRHERTHFELPLNPSGTEFQKHVWRELLTIPYGHTVTYGELAIRLSTSARAIGNAVSKNPISIIIPCHRVIGAGNQLTGYAGGLNIKENLLNHESYLRGRTN